jgi:NAD(P)-dependent dehydrogenase (short-subunit alcohol dehydrogenase family)
MEQTTALVTGATRGIGKAVAARLVRLGYRVVVGARQRAAAREVAEELGAVGLALDVTDADSVQEARDAVGHVDILVNNAAILLDDGSPISSIEPALLTRHVAVNAAGALLVTQAFLPGMLARGWGRVTMLSSENGTLRAMQPEAPAYSVSKVGLNAITVLLAREVEGTGVLVNAVSPGRVRTRMLPSGDRTPEEAAVGVVAVATLPDGGPNGLLFRDGRPIDW